LIIFITFEKRAPDKTLNNWNDWSWARLTVAPDSGKEGRQSNLKYAEKNVNAVKGLLWNVKFAERGVNKQ
jgi:hypothetical protein